MNDKPSYLGHRARVKEKFLNSDPNSFYDYELLELLLFSAQPRKDVKPTAKKLLEKFGSLKSAISANSDVLKEIDGINDGTILTFKIIKEINRRILREEIEKKIIINNWESLINYAKSILENLTNEQFRVVFLDKKHLLIADEIFQNGNVESVEIDVKEIAKKALIFQSSSVILMHNHPSGDSKPSKFDIVNTNNISQTLKPLNIRILDHIIIGKNNYFSFKNNGIL